MNPITALKIAGLGEAAKGVFGATATAGAELGKLVGAEGPGRVLGYAAPILAANYGANQFAPTRRAKAWLGEQIASGHPRLGQAFVPSDYGMRPGDR